MRSRSPVSAPTSFSFCVRARARSLLVSSRLLLEDLHLPRGVREAASQEGDLVLQESHLELELVDLLLVPLLLLPGDRSRACAPPPAWCRSIRPTSDVPGTAVSSSRLYVAVGRSGRPSVPRQTAARASGIPCVRPSGGSRRTLRLVTCQERRRMPFVSRCSNPWSWNAGPNAGPAPWSAGTRRRSRPARRGRQRVQGGPGLGQVEDGAVESLPVSATARTSPSRSSRPLGHLVEEGVDVLGGLRLELRPSS